MSGSRHPAVSQLLTANWQQKQKSAALGRLNANVAKGISLRRVMLVFQGISLRRVMLVFQDLPAHRFTQAQRPQTPSFWRSYQNRQRETLMLLCAMAVLLQGLLTLIMRLNHHQAFR